MSPKAIVPEGARKVLIIDDAPAIGHIFSRIVEKEGHLPAVASTLSEGLKLLGSDDFDLVFLDIRLPDANGLEHISEITEGASFPEVIIITAFGSQEAAEIALKSGALDYIEKPSSPDLITLRLVRALEHHRTKMFWLKMREAFEKAK